MNQKEPSELPISSLHGLQQLTSFYKANGIFSMGRNRWGPVEGRAGSETGGRSLWALIVTEWKTKADVLNIHCVPSKTRARDETGSLSH